MSLAAPRKSATAKGASPQADKPSKVSPKAKSSKATAAPKSAPAALKAPAVLKGASAVLKGASAVLKGAPAVKASAGAKPAVGKVNASKASPTTKASTAASAKKSQTSSADSGPKSIVAPKGTAAKEAAPLGRPDRFARTARRTDPTDPESAVLPVLAVDFAVGEVAVHPAHGVGRIASIEDRDFGGTNSQVYVLHIAGSGLRVMVPKGTAARVGLRPVMTAAEADSILQVLATPEVAVSMQPWNRRFRAYTEMIASGSATEIAKVLRDMHRLKFDKELSFGERRLLDQAKGLLVQELALAKDQRAEEMESAIEQIFAA